MELVVQEVPWVCSGGGRFVKCSPIQRGAPHQRLPIRDAPCWAEMVEGTAAGISQLTCTLSHVESRCPNKAMIWRWVSLTLKSIFYCITVLKLKEPLITYPVHWITWMTDQYNTNINMTLEFKFLRKNKIQSNLLIHNFLLLFLLSWNCVLAEPTGII